MRGFDLLLLMGVDIERIKRDGVEYCLVRVEEDGLDISEEIRLPEGSVVISHLLTGWEKDIAVVLLHHTKKIIFAEYNFENGRLKEIQNDKDRDFLASLLHQFIRESSEHK